MTAKREFALDGRSCAEFGVICSGSGTYGAPERDVENIEIPGRSGDIIIEHDRFKNIKVTYPCFVPKGLQANMEGLRAWLLSGRGYRRLTDGYDTAHYRMAQYKAALEPEIRAQGRAAEFDVVFDCQPQRWLLTGETEITLESGQQLQNPTSFAALPLITVYGTGAGVLTVGTVSVEIKRMPDGVLVLDCEKQDAYSGSTNRNNTIQASEFPSLPAGKTAVSWSGNITGVKIVPRWWTL